MNFRDLNPFKARRLHRRRTGIGTRLSPFRSLRCETLEERRLLAILWGNEGTADFSDFGDNETIARVIVNRAITDWEAVINDFDFDGDSNPATKNTFDLTVIEAAIIGRGTTTTQFTNGKPTAATITLDNDGGGFGWYFDSTPLDDAEFTAIVNSGLTGTGPSFQASFVDVDSGYVDFYRTIVHEIGHAVGLASSSPVFAIASPFMTFIGPDPNIGGGSLYSFNNSNGQYGVTATITTNGGRHFFENDHPNDLMNPGRVTPIGTL